MPGTVDVQIQAEQVAGSDSTFRLPIDRIDGGWSTRTYPTLLPSNYLAVADNCFSIRDGLPSKRPGNGYYGGSATGKIGSGQPVLAMERFYYATAGVYNAALVAHSGNALYRGNDNTGVWSAIAGAAPSTTFPASFAAIYDPDMSSGAADALVVCDGVNPPHLYDGTNYVAVATGAGNLPMKRDGVTPITPRFCIPWGLSLVYAGESSEPQAIYISDAMHPEKFTGLALVVGAAESYYGVWPAGRTTQYGRITGLARLGEYLLVFYERAVVAGLNTGAYGAFQFQWKVLSVGVGAAAARSIVQMDSYIVFFGGDRFYATDGQTVVPLPDELPTVYSYTAKSAQPPEIKDPTTLFGMRRGSAYWASYDAGSGHLERILVFDTNGWNYGDVQGGAWWRWPTGMQLGCGVECRGGNDAKTTPAYWGSSTSDVTAQHDVGTFDDFGAPIEIELRTKSFTFEKPLAGKTVQAVYVILVMPNTSGSYTVELTTYALEDTTTATAPTTTVQVDPSGVTYGSQAYGTFVYRSALAQLQISVKTFPQASGPASTLACGVQENSTNPISVLGFVIEATLDPTI